MKSIDDLLRDHQEFHSDLQMESFITIRSGGTLYGCYKQALRELNTRKTAAIQRITQFRLMMVDIRERECEVIDSFRAERNKIQNEEARSLVSLAEQTIEDVLREYAHFYGQALSIQEALESQGVKFPLNGPTRDRLDREMWEHQLKARCAVELMSSARLANTTIELIQACPCEMRKRLVACLRPDRQGDLIDWFLGFEPKIPTAKAIEPDEVRKLIGCS